MKFLKDFEQSIKFTLDGRKFRYLKFNWKKFEPINRIELLQKPDDRKRTFSKAAYTNKEVLASEIISNEKKRKELIQIGSTVFFRHNNLLRRSKKDGVIEADLLSLEKSNLIDLQYLVQCKKFNSSLVKLENTELLNSEMGSLICPKCNSKYRDELVIKGYALTKFCKTLLSKSHWMTIIVTNQLVESGIPLEGILWNLSQNGEEIDIIVEFKGQLLIFELKDRVFGAGDAHPLNYRRVKFEADKTIIITTEKVSKDAKRVFSDLSRENIGRKGNFTPLYIEGLENVGKSINQLIRDVSIKSILNKSTQLSELTSYNVNPVLNTIFNELDAFTKKYYLDDDLPF